MDEQGIEIYEEDRNSITNSNKIEVTDKAILGRISQTFPGLMTIVANSCTADKIGSMYLIKGLKSGDTLAKSGNTAGAFRGFVHGKNGIKYQVDLVEAGGSVGGAIQFSSVINIASMIVGQYYMSQLTEQMKEVNKKLDEILALFEGQVKAKIETYKSCLKEIIAHKSEILENEELRRREISEIDRIKAECQTTLGEANEKLLRLCNGKPKNEKEFVKNFGDIEKWCNYRNTLYSVMCMISELDYLLSFGRKSKEYCNERVNDCYKNCIEVNKNIKQYGAEVADRLGNTIGDKIRDKIYDGILDENIGKSFGILQELVQNAILNRQIAKIGHELDALALSEGSAKFLSEIKYKPSGNELFGRNFELSIEDGKIYYIKPEGQV